MSSVHVLETRSLSLVANRGWIAPRVKIDASAFPHVMDAIVFAASADVLRAFWGVSKRCRDLVDRLIASHLVLEGEIPPTFPWTPAAVLHNGLPGQRLRIFLQDTDKSPRTVLGVPAFPERSELQQTRTLDIRGKLRYEVLLGLPSFPKINTVRMYEYYAAAPHSTGAGKTRFWGSSPREPYLPAARRLVIFSSLELCKHASYFKAQLPRHYPPNVEDIVLHLTLPSSSGDWAPLDLPPTPPSTLKRVTVILAPPMMSISLEQTTTPTPFVAQPIGDHDIAPIIPGNPTNVYAEGLAGTDVTEAGSTPPLEPKFDLAATQAAVADLAAMLNRLGAPATLVGGENLGNFVADRALHALAEAGVMFKSESAMRAEIGKLEWAVCTQEAGFL